MEFRGTKGKWYRGIGTGVVSMSTQTKVAQANGANYKESMANALLISKAPEMLDMLRSVLDLQISNYGDATGTHLDLIGKAKEIEQLIKEATELTKEVLK